MRLGVLGGGQLGRMLGLAALPLDIQCRFLDPAADAPAGHVGELHVGDFRDEGALARFADGLDAATYEFENVPVIAAERLASRLDVRPGVEALRVGQDRVLETEFFGRCGLALHRKCPAGSSEELEEAARTVGLPAVIKTRRGGYDGKGQRIARSAAEVRGAWDALGGVELLAEELVRFRRELSLVAVRGADGAFDAYPLVQNVHWSGVLRETVAPAPDVSAELGAAARSQVRALMEALEYVGVLAVEFFEAEREGGVVLLANEMAPRVHNTGHWTIEGAMTSQFENHVRAVAGLPLGSCGARGMSVMLNLIGRVPPLAALLAVPGAHVHLYSKQERPGRKVGHVTIAGLGESETLKSASRVRALIEASGD